MTAVDVLNLVVVFGLGGGLVRWVERGLWSRGGGDSGNAPRIDTRTVPPSLLVPPPSAVPPPPKIVPPPPVVSPPPMASIVPPSPGPPTAPPLAPPPLPPVAVLSPVVAPPTAPRIDTRLSSVMLDDDDVDGRKGKRDEVGASPVPGPGPGPCPYCFRGYMRGVLYDRADIRGVLIIGRI